MNDAYRAQRTSIEVKSNETESVQIQDTQKKPRMRWERQRTTELEDCGNENSAALGHPRCDTATAKPEFMP